MQTISLPRCSHSSRSASPAGPPTKGISTGTGRLSTLPRWRRRPCSRSSALPSRHSRLHGLQEGRASRSTRRGGCSSSWRSCSRSTSRAPVISLRTARQYGSEALRSNAIHFGSDFAGTLAVLAGLADRGGRLSGGRLDRSASHRRPRAPRRRPADPAERRRLDGPGARGSRSDGPRCDRGDRAADLASSASPPARPPDERSPAWSSPCRRAQWSVGARSRRPGGGEARRGPARRTTSSSTSSLEQMRWRSATARLQPRCQSRESARSTTSASSRSGVRSSSLSI